MYQRDRINRNKTEEDPSMWNWNEETKILFPEEYDKEKEERFDEW